MLTRTVFIILLTCSLLACSLFTQRNEPDEALQPPPQSTGNPPTAGTSAPPYFGEESIEERVARRDTIVRARLNHTTSEIITTMAEEWSGKYYVALKFHLTVSEYLNGSGVNSITALTVQGDTYDTRKEAEDAMPGIVARRATTWDDREAILFLNSDDPYDTFDAVVQAANDYFLTVGGPREDMYSLHNRYRKLWLPSAGTTGTGDNQEFLLAVPEHGIDTPTITLGELKRRIAAVNAELNTGDGSDAYRDCIVNKYRSVREKQHDQSEGRKGNPRAVYDTHSLMSGSSAGTVIFESDAFGDYPNGKSKTWLEDGDAALFEIVDGPTTPRDRNSDGVLTAGVDDIRYTQSLRPMRPIPAAEYRFNVKDQAPINVPCNDVYSTEWTVTVTAPAGTLHEAFFDPVTVGSAIAADATNGVLKPTAFTDGNGASATLQRVAWEAGTVKLKLSPHTGLANHVLDLIALDGTVSLSLDADEATVDVANNTLSWPVPSQPWKSGDKLMLRIHDGTVTIVPTPAATSAKY